MLAATLAGEDGLPDDLFGSRDPSLAVWGDVVNPEFECLGAPVPSEGKTDTDVGGKEEEVHAGFLDWKKGPPGTRDPVGHG